jgi:RHH-type proline utilization regulon transcriptional repressor/proline dehydrogenase/delta 1-pyrroline-5-carboxylate dehydrogenase
MIVDSTALLEQAVRDVIASAFQSAGQRCSALRCLYVQEDIAPAFREMLFGAIDELTLGDPWHLSTSIGSVIDTEAHQDIRAYISGAKVAKRIDAPEDGLFIAPTVIDVPGIATLKREIFGPVLHMATYPADQIEKVISDINGMGYGLTFGLHTRIDSRVQDIVERIACGNVYVNRNQIGAVVGSQPFGGEGLSGTGPKAGGPAYVLRFCQSGDIDATPVREMPGPTGETNRLSLHARPPFLCLGPGIEMARSQAAAVTALGGRAEIVPDLPPDALRMQTGTGGALWWGNEDLARAYAIALSMRDGPILPLLTDEPLRFEVMHERHLCVDTTASGGNAELLASVSGA